MTQSPGVARWLRFRPSFWLLLVLFLITGFPAVDDLWQELANLFNLLLSPTVYPHPFGLDKLGRRNLTGCDIAAQGCGINSEFPSCLASGEERNHSAVSVADSLLKGQGEKPSCGNFLVFSNR